jgi:eukaryotic-like serine/threonine-protein kinase
MASEAGKPPPEGERADQPHVSFVQRLQRHFSGSVDPRIDLQDEDDSASRVKEPGSRTPTSVEDFVRRLSPAVDAGSRYEVKQDVASGGMGTIFRVWDSDLRRNLAMKVMHGKGVGSSHASEGSGAPPVDPERLGRFLEEAQITGQLDHPGVVPVHDLGIDSKGRCYFTMRFVRGRELKEVLDLAREAKDGWTRTKVLGVILKVCEAMAYAHSKGVVHRDLKPANVMVGRFGETYVMDWGLARVLGRRDSHDLRLKPRVEDASALSLVRTVRRDETDSNPDSPLVTMDGDVIGTPSYMAPEQARGKLEEVGPRSDVYSLGAILYYMHTGQAAYVRPGERVSPHTVLSRVLDAPPIPVEKLAPHEPPELIAICEKAMARDPEQRYGSMLEVADDIQAFLENRVVRAYERGSLAEFKKWVVRNKGMAAGIAGMLTLALASGIFFFVQQRSENAQLRIREGETLAAKNEAEKNLVRAKESEVAANKNLDLANERSIEAARQARMAEDNEESAKRSGYAANILAADYSLKLNEMGEARSRLRLADERLRGFEWQHLNQRTSAPLVSLGKFSGVEALGFRLGEDQALILTSQGRLECRDISTRADVPPEDISVAPDTLLLTLRRLFSNLAFDLSPDGTRIAIVGEGSAMHVFDLETGTRPAGVERAGLPGHNARTSAAAFSPDGRLLASGDDDGQILVRDALNWEIRQRLALHIGQITGLAFSPGSERLASSSRDGSLRVWDLESGRGLTTFKGHRGAVRAVAWDLENERLFSAGEDGSVNLWDVQSGRLVRSFLGHEGPVNSLDYDANRGRLVTGSADRTVRVWDVATGSSRVLLGHEFPVKEVAFDPAGERVISGDQDGVVYVWDAEGDLSTTELAMHRDSVTALAFDPAGKLLVTASQDHELVLWDAGSGEPLRRMREHTGPVNSVVFAADGKSFLSGSHDKTVRVWDAETGAPMRTFGPFDRWVVSAVLTPDGARVVVATGDKRVRVFDARTTEVLRELPQTMYAADALVLSPDGTRIAMVGRDFSVWDLGGDLSAPLYVEKGRNTAVAFAADGRMATGTLAGLLQLRDASGQWLLDRQDHTAKIRALAFSPDGERLVSCSEDGEIRVRDSRTGATLLVLQEPRGAVVSLAFSPDGSRLATGIEDGTVRIYETRPAAERRLLRQQTREQREQARELVDALFGEFFRLADVLRALDGDRGLSQPLREAALRQAYLRGDDPLPLWRRTIDECLDFEREQSLYAHALERATAAASLKGNAAGMPGWELDGLSRLALGAASYRNALYAEARNQLRGEVVPTGGDITVSRGIFGQREQALRLLFLCMSQCQTKEYQDAERSWRLAQQSVLDDVELSQRSELIGLLSEVETLVRSSAQPAGS